MVSFLIGIAYPTCISVGNNVCHLSPLTTDEEFKIVLKAGDMVRIEMGAHVDEYPCQVAHTVIVGSSVENPVKGTQADVLKAANICQEAILRLMKHGNSSSLVVDAVEKITKEFNCNAVIG